jgi:hypothetical protein
VAAVVFGLNAAHSPDYTDDEVLYSVIGQHIGRYDSVSGALGPLLVHPPLFFLLVSLWESITGTIHSPTLDAIHSVRYLNVLLCSAIVALTGLLAHTFSSPQVRERAYSWRVVLAMLLVMTDGLMIRFGRVVLIDPLAVLMGLLIVIAAYRLRRGSALAHILVVGALIGLGCLVKQTVAFAAIAPLLASLIMHQRREAYRQVAALALGAAIWMVFPLWAATSQLGGALASQESNSVKRLLGLVQVTGVNKSTSSPLSLLTDTLGEYLSAYLLLLVGGFSLVVLIVRRGVLRRQGPRPDARLAYLVAYAFLAYLFVTYSFAFGQGNEQLTIYAIPAGALTSVLVGQFPRQTRGRRARRSQVPTAILSLVLSGIVLLGALAWGRYFAFNDDDGTQRMASYISVTLADTCTQINATGDQDRWQAAITGQQVTGYSDGPQALQNHIHYFLLSPKDAKNSYGNSNPALAQWIVGHGTLLHSVPSQTYDAIQLWLVGRDQGAPARATCALADSRPHDHASAVRFGGLLGGGLALVALIGVGGRRFGKRRLDR